MNRNDHRAFVPFTFTAFDGAYSDDDTDIEFVTLHAVEQHGLGITYPQITEAWKRRINRRIWVANRAARDLMDQGMIPPDTGAKENNPHWFQIDPQLVNEIWSALYPGMPARATQRAEWGARITSDDWGGTDDATDIWDALLKNLHARRSARDRQRSPAVRWQRLPLPSRSRARRRREWALLSARDGAGCRSQPHSASTPDLRGRRTSRPGGSDRLRRSTTDGRCAGGRAGACDYRRNTRWTSWMYSKR